MGYQETRESRVKLGSKETLGCVDLWDHPAMMERWDSQDKMGFLDKMVQMVSQGC